MTGFARAEGGNDFCTWAWEAKSVNAKGLDVRLRLAGGFEALEAVVRERAKGRFRRGNLSLNLNVNWQRAGASYRLNAETLEQVLDALPTLRERLPDAPPVSIDGLLGVKGVMETVEEPLAEDDQAQVHADVLEGLEATLTALAEGRGKEGAQLTELVSGQLGAIETLCAAAEDLAAMRPDAIRARLEEQVAELAAAVPAIPEDRLAQEAALLMVKADVREELDRLAAHVEAARELIGTDGAVGRQFDFLCQEFNREANTLCSKSSDVALTRIGLELKTVIDQMREQVQNIE